MAEFIFITTWFSVGYLARIITLFCEKNFSGEHQDISGVEILWIGKDIKETFNRKVLYRAKGVGYCLFLLGFLGLFVAIFYYSIVWVLYKTDCIKDIAHSKS